MTIIYYIDTYNQESDYSDICFTNNSDNQDLLNNSSLSNENIVGVYKNSTLVQTYVASCLTQKNIKLDKIKSITKTQIDTREHARHWLDKLAPKISSIYTDVTGFCNLAGDEKEGYWKDLINTAYQIKNKNDENMSDFKIILQDLKKDIHERQQKTSTLIDDLASFRGDLENDNRNFQDIIADAQRIYAGSGGEIETIKKNIDAIKSAIDENIKIISGGAILVTGGILMIAVGAIGSVFTGGAAAKLIVAGVIATGTGITLIAVASKDLIEKRKNYGKALNDLARIEGEMAALKNVEDNFCGLKSKNEYVHAAIESMRQGWIVLNNNFNELEKSAENINPERRVTLVNRLKASQKNFESLTEQAKNMQKNSILQVEVTPEVQQYLGLPKTFYSFPAYSCCTKRLVNTASCIIDLRELAELIR